jgi:hypothetical protein
MDGDGQHPTTAIPEMILAAERADADLVIGIRADYSYQSAPSRLMRRAFYKLFNALSQTKLPYGIGDFNLYRPIAADAIRSLRENDLFLKGLVAWIGFDPVYVKYKVRNSSTDRPTRWSLRKLLNLAISGLTSFTDWPLRVWSLFGTILALSSFVYLAATLVQTLFYGNKVEGYPSLIMSLLGLGGIQLLSIGVLGNYLGRTYMQSKQRPRYIIQETSSGKHSRESLQIPTNRR